MSYHRHNQNYKPSPDKQIRHRFDFFLLLIVCAFVALIYWRG